MRLISTAMIAFSLCTGVFLNAEETLKWTHSGEKLAWERIADRFSGEPKVQRNRNGDVERIEVRNLKKDPKDSGWARIAFNTKSGHAIEISSDRAGFTNEEFQLFQSFTKLEKLTLWHNSNFHDKNAAIENYDASGIKHLAGLKKLERITLAGGGFDDAGMVEAAQLPHLKYLGMWHVRVSDAGMSALQNHPGLEEIRLGPFWGKLMTNQTIAHLATCPNLKKLSVGETWLTYEDGLHHLVQRKNPLEELNLSNTLISPEDVHRIKMELSETVVKWEGLSAAGKILNDSGWHKGKAIKWMPEELLNSAMNAASNPEKK
jgi:hypothetical protein